MAALVLVQTVVIVVLVVLVAGLLRSHAEILRALHDLGAGLEDPNVARRAQQARRRDGLARARASRQGGSPGVDGGSPGVGASLAPGVSPPAFVTGDPVFDIVGQSAHGTAVAVAIEGTGRRTLLAFLTSGCTTCQGFWDSLRQPGLELPPEVDRVVVVTHSQNQESPALIGRLSPPGAAGITVVMADEPWETYRVPATPYFVLADGATNTIVGEGAAKGWPQLLGLLRRAVADTEPSDEDEVALIDLATGDRDRVAAGGGAGAAANPGGPAGRGRSGRRRDRADAALAAAGIEPGHPSLFAGDAPTGGSEPA